MTLTLVSISQAKNKHASVGRTAGRLAAHGALATGRSGPSKRTLVGAVALLLERLDGIDPARARKVARQAHNAPSVAAGYLRAVLWRHCAPEFESYSSRVAPQQEGHLLEVVFNAAECGDWSQVLGVLRGEALS
jgi:hypothetical protein